MTLEELAEQVRLMRIAQGNYFRNRTEENLQTSKRLERELDDLVRRIKSGEINQPKLFE